MGECMSMKQIAHLRGHSIDCTKHTQSTCLD